MKLINYSLITILIIILNTLTACSPIEVNTNYNQLINLTSYKTISWKKLALTNTNHSEDIIRLDKSIRQAMNQILTQKGYRFVEQGFADILIDYNIKFEQKETTIAMEENNRYGPQWEFGDGRGVNYSGVQGPKQEYYSYEQGILTVRLYDSQSNTMIWESVANKVTNRKNNYKNLEANINRAINQMFKKYPTITE